MRRAKIVCTLGPATDSYDQIKALVDAGMDVARLNLSHGSYAEHEERYRRVRKAADETGRSVGVLVDLQGPKIRLETFAEGPVLLERGDAFTITTEDVPGDRHCCGTTYKGLCGDVSPGERILVDDGRVALEVTSVEGSRVNCTVVEGGMVSDHKGLNLPGVAVSVPALSDKDVADLLWGLRIGADMIALSFVRSAEDIKDVHRIMEKEGRFTPVIAKVEKPQAVQNLESIVDAFDGVMVARGDLGVEMPLEQVPLVQKRAIKLCRRNAKPVIVATQMLDSMIHASRPTRAEASDVANAVLDGADAVMLSGETSVGKYPVETVRTMSRIVAAAEEDIIEAGLPPLTESNKPRTQGGAVARAAAEIGDFLDAKYLVAFTQSGDTARRLSRYRSPIPVLAFTYEPAVRSRLSLSWGVETFMGPLVDTTDEMVAQVDAALLDIGRCEPGDIIVITAGSPPGRDGSTNLVRVHHVGQDDSPQALPTTVTSTTTVPSTPSTTTPGR
jgi:pyruvate kinase